MLFYYFRIFIVNYFRNLYLLVVFILFFWSNKTSFHTTSYQTDCANTALCPSISVTYPYMNEGIICFLNEFKMNGYVICLRLYVSVCVKYIAKCIVKERRPKKSTHLKIKHLMRNDRLGWGSHSVYVIFVECVYSSNRTCRH